MAERERKMHTSLQANAGTQGSLFLEASAGCRGISPSIADLGSRDSLLEYLPPTMVISNTTEV